ncbi:unnamed protein product [Debaryomyces tyrocola]|nr:unnamed protein product [Debaryomyces tyrocola]
MSAQLNLSGEDIQKLTTCWSSLQANNKYHKDDFITRLFSNLVAANPKLRKVFHSESIITEQSTLFGDLLSFTMLYLDDEYTLNQCMNAFLRENPKFVEVGSEYLEPMGSALIVTFRQWLGQGTFNDQIQSLWVQVYLYIANCILQFEESLKETRSLEEAPIEALRPRRRPPVEQITKEEVQQEQQPEAQSTQPEEKKEENDNIHNEIQQEAPQPEITQDKSIKPLNTSTIQFQLSNNEKYRGFRRSVQCSEVEPISIQIPNTPTFQQVTPPLSPPSAPFDPRKMRSLSRSPASLNEQELTLSNENSSSFDPRGSRRRSPSTETEECEPILTPRSSRRGSSLKELIPEPVQQQQVQAQQAQQAQPKQQTPKIDPRKMAFTKPSNVISDDSDDEFTEKEKGFGFDPRRLSKRKSQSPVISDEESEFEPTSPLFNSHSRETSVSDVEDDSYNFEVKQEPSVERTKPSAFDYNSFGIKGLEPIVESEFDDTASSKYESDEDVDNDNASSRYGTRLSSDGDEISSGASTLSLHNSDFRSSINSGSDATSVSPSPDLNKFQMSHGVRQTSTSSDVSSMNGLSAQSAEPIPAVARLQSSSASLSSTYQMSRTSSQQQFKQRASLGFMRSSFILKKEISEQGFNEPENVLLKPPTIPAAVSSSSNSSAKNSTASLQSTISSGTGSDGCYDLLNSFVPVTNLSNDKQATKTMASSTRATPRHVRSNSDLQSTNSYASTESKRKSLRSRLSSIFSSSSSTTTTRKSSLACDLTSDLASICTTDTNRSNISGFSFFKKRNSIDSRYSSSQKKGMKYNVKAVPYDVFAK